MLLKYSLNPHHKYTAWVMTSCLELAQRNETDAELTDDVARESHNITSRDKLLLIINRT